MKTITYEIKGNVATVTIDYPPANALSSLIFRELKQKLEKIEQTSTAKVIILTGKGKFFSAGADIKEFTSLKDASDYQALSEMGQVLFEKIENYHIPIIAAIHGAALGGGLELAMACHLRIATGNAQLGLPELTLGLIPGFAGTQRLPPLVGIAKAYEMMLTGDAITGDEAYTLGLVNKVVNEEMLLAEADILANKIAEKSTSSIHKIMELIPYSKTKTFSEGSKAEAIAFSEIINSEDAREGIQAFMNKRKPNFQDK